MFERFDKLLLTLFVCGPLLPAAPFVNVSRNYAVSFAPTPLLSRTHPQCSRNVPRVERVAENHESDRCHAFGPNVKDEPRRGWRGSCLARGVTVPTLALAPCWAVSR